MKIVEKCSKTVNRLDRWFWQKKHNMGSLNDFSEHMNLFILISCANNMIAFALSTRSEN